MTDIIRLLPDAVANQIAAGEVIQRPASVVKELVENAIDAGASLIQVWITDAGKTSIQVVDNGKGMSETDARLSFERHATSKITQAIDLYNLHTMGFRGEALASIAAVAQVEVKTRTAETEIGVQLSIEASHVTDYKPVVCPIGTNFLIRNLFYNVPARRKFLKSDHTEFRRIIEEIERLALANHHIGFQLYHNDNAILNMSQTTNKQRIVQLFGKKIEPQLLPVKVTTPIITIHGFVVAPDDVVKKGANQYFFVNNRYMRHPYFLKAVQSAYERLIHEGDQPHLFLYLDVAPDRIDVNVHPTKTEIKFEDEQEIWKILLAAVKETIGRYSVMPQIDFDTENKPDLPPFSATATQLTMPNVTIDQAYNPFAGFTDAQTISPETQDAIPSQIVNIAPLTEPNIYHEQNEADQQQWENTQIPCLQHASQYIIASLSDALLLIDQHRAHLRILYDTFLAMIQRSEGNTQRLIFPDMLQLSPSQAQIFDGILPEVTQLGFDIVHLGGHSYGIHGVPQSIEGVSAVSLLHNLIEVAVNKQTDIKEDVYHLIALTLARKAAITRGQILSLLEMQNIVHKLLQSTHPQYTPEAHRIYYVLSAEDFAKFMP